VIFLKQKDDELNVFMYLHFYLIRKANQPYLTLEKLLLDFNSARQFLFAHSLDRGMKKLISKH
jgi:hypothetical protein